MITNISTSTPVFTAASASTMTTLAKSASSMSSMSTSTAASAVLLALPTEKTSTPDSQTPKEKRAFNLFSEKLTGSPRTSP